MSRTDVYKRFSDEFTAGLAPTLPQDSISLREALATVPGPGVQAALPLMLRLQVDPDLSFLGQLVFKAGIDRTQHDCIHILLGRGLESLDQAFVLGFTIGCSNKGSIPEHKLNAELGRHFMRQQRSLLDESQEAVFKEGIKLAYLSFCAPLEKFDFTAWQDNSLSELRLAVGLEAELLLAYYAIEKYHYPHVLASQRLLPDEARASEI